MRISAVRIQNFRGFKDETIQIDDYTCFVGSNGAGKSTVLAALNVFFRQHKDSKTDLSRLSVDDFHHKEVSEPIRITVHFSDLSPQAKIDLADYVRQDQLIVSSVAHYDPNSQRAEVKQYGNRLGIAEFGSYFRADKEGASAKDLQSIFKAISEKFALEQARTKQEMADALRRYESEHPSETTLLPSEDQFYGATKGVNRLAPHLQWIFVSASKDITQETDEKKDSVLGLLLTRTIRSKVNFTHRVAEIRSTVAASYQKMLDAEQVVLDDLSVSIEAKLKNWAHPDATAKILWKQDPDKSVKVEEPSAFVRIGERGFESELARFGHGMQRSCMLALLQEIASTEPGAQVPTLIMGIEEPELYQHPPQARYLAEVLRELSNSGSQIILCSHSPLFIPGESFESIRVVRERGTPAASYVSQVKYSDLAEKLNDCGDKLYRDAGMMAKLYSTLSPSMNEMFFCKVLILVESMEDIAYLYSGLNLEGKMNEFRRHGCHVVPVGRKSDLLKPMLMAKLLQIPVYVIFDADTYEEHPEKRRQHMQDNGRLLSALGIADKELEWPLSDIWRSDCTVWSTEIGVVARSEIGDAWSTHYQDACANFSNPGGLEKNPLAISKTLETAWAAGNKSPSIVRLATNVLAFATNGVLAST